MKLTFAVAHEMLVGPGRLPFEAVVRVVGYREAAHWERRFYGGVLAQFARPQPRRRGT